MSKNSSLSDEWKDTVYELGGAFVGLGRTLFRSVKAGVDYAYDRFYEEDNRKKTSSSSSKREKDETVVESTAKEMDDEE